MPIVRVALDVPMSTLFDYLLNVDWSVEIGQRVLVPFGRKQVTGIVMELAESSELASERIKSVTQVLDDVPPLPAELLTLLRFCSDYYHHPLGMTVMSALPARLRAQEPVTIKQELSFTLTAQGRSLDPAFIPKRRVIQHRILQALQNAALTGIQIRALSPGVPANLKIMIEQGWVEPCSIPAAAPVKHSFNNIHLPTAAQQQAIDAVTQTQGYRCFLLHGITGSGKTEVYVHLMHQALQRGEQVLLLVPEINLTPQLENYFRSRFPDAELASLHSGLSDGERITNW